MNGWSDFINGVLVMGEQEINEALSAEGVTGELREGIKDLAKLYVEIQFAKAVGKEIGDAERAADAARLNYQAAGVITASELAKKVASRFLSKIGSALQVAIL